MSDLSSGQHDTAALPRVEGPRDSQGAEPSQGAWTYGAVPYSAQPDSAQPYGGRQGPATSPQTDHWYGQYLRQRRRTRVMTGLVILLSLAVVGLGALSVVLARSNPLTTALSGITSEAAPQLPLDPGTQDPSPGTTDAPPSATPDAPSGEQPSIPLPGPLADLGARLGITDAGQLIDLAVANGLISEEDADALRRALAAGAELGAGT